jgi:hypothetical protein
MVFSGVGWAYQEIFAAAGTVRASEARWLGGGDFWGWERQRLSGLRFLEVRCCMCLGIFVGEFGI